MGGPSRDGAVGERRVVVGEDVDKGGGPIVCDGEADADGAGDED